jgi:hypothetical protein
MFGTRTAKLVLCVVAFMCFGASPAQGSSFTVFSFNQGISQCGSLGGVPSSTPVLNYSLQCSSDYHTSLMQGSASLTEINVYADLTITDGLNLTSRIIADTIAQTFDTIVITGGTGAGTLSFAYEVSGDSGLGGNIPGCIEDFDCSFLTLQITGNSIVTFDTFTGDGELSGSIPFVFGQPFQFDVYAEAIAQIKRLSPMGTFNATDFFNTITLQPFTVFNSDGTLATDALVVSTSGFQYSTAIPEPSVLALLAAGFGVLAWHRRRSVNQT